MFRQHLSWWHLSISGISQLLVTRFWPNFKGRFLGPSLTDVNCHGIICLGNICPGHICSYQHNLSCYWLTSFWPKFWDLIFCINISDVTDTILLKLLRPNFLEALNFGGQFFCWKIFFWPKYFLDQKFFCTQIYLLFWPKYILSEKFFVPKICWIEHSIQVNFLGRIFLDPHFLYKKCFGPNFFEQNQQQ